MADMKKFWENFARVQKEELEVARDRARSAHDYTLRSINTKEERLIRQELIRREKINKKDLR